MKKLRCLFALILVLAFVISLTSCYVISGLSMNKLKGTYKLTRYTYTPSYERKEGYTPRTHDYVNDAEYKYEDYLVITGTNTGYYVHKEASGESYVKEITLSYEYSQEKSGKVEYVILNDSITVNGDEGGINRLGVAKNNLNYSKSSINYTQIITKKPMCTEALSVRWEKVDKATDLSYASSQIGDMKYYTYSAFAARGIYELNTYVVTETLEHLLPYQYFFIVVDTADGTNTATVYYATKEAPTEQIKKTVSFSANADFSVLTIDGDNWSISSQFGSGYYNTVKGEYTIEIRLATNDISQSSVDSFLRDRLPAED